MMIQHYDHDCGKGTYHEPPCGDIPEPPEDTIQHMVPALQIAWRQGWTAGYKARSERQSNVTSGYPFCPKHSNDWPCPTCEAERERSEVSE